MSEGKDQDQGKGRLSLRPAGRSEVGRTVDAGSVRQSFSHGRSKVVQVEVRKKRGANLLERVAVRVVRVQVQGGR